MTRTNSIIGLGLALGGVAAVAWWILRRQSSSSGSGDALSGVQRIGADIRQDVTPALVDRALDFAQSQIDRARCWRFVRTEPTHDVYQRADDPTVWTYVPSGMIPPNVCSNF